MRTWPGTSRSPLTPLALTRDLQRSRESLVAAREEERRRIRRDLHDGLGPALAGVAFGLDAARNTLAANPEATAATLAELKTEVQASIADVRRLVYDLRPPALDQLGLVPALQQYAARLAERGALDVSVSAPALPPLPAAVEVAAYRIVTEALTNAARHSGARHTCGVIHRRRRASCGSRSPTTGSACPPGATAAAPALAWPRWPSAPPSSAAPAPPPPATAAPPWWPCCPWRWPP